MAAAALKNQYTSFLDKTKVTFPESWDKYADTLPEEPIRQFFLQYYKMAAPIALKVRKNMLGEKAANDDEMLTVFEQYMLHLVNNEAGDMIKTITGTSRETILKMIRQTLSDGELNGWGVDKIRSELFKTVGKNLRSNAFSRARAIAQTEIVKAANQAQMKAANSTNLEFRKYWLTSKLEGVRPTHQEAERYSIEKGGLRKDETFPNGLLHPGDPAGSAAEVINCRCQLVTEIV